MKLKYNPFKLAGSWIGAILIFSIFAYNNYLPPYCTEYPICTHEEAIKPSAVCCPPSEPFKCFSPVQETYCTFSGYLINPYGFGSAILGFLLGYIIHILLIKKKIIKVRK